MLTARRPCSLCLAWRADHSFAGECRREMEIFQRQTDWICPTSDRLPYELQLKRRFWERDARRPAGPSARQAKKTRAVLMARGPPQSHILKQFSSPSVQATGQRPQHRGRRANPLLFVPLFYPFSFFFYIFPSLARPCCCCCLLCFARLARFGSRELLGSVAPSLAQTPICRFSTNLSSQQVPARPAQPTRSLARSPVCLSVINAGRGRSNPIPIDSPSSPRSPSHPIDPVLLFQDRTQIRR